MSLCKFGAALIVLYLSCSFSYGQSVFLDFETPNTGSNLGSMPLGTSSGSITFNGEFRTLDGNDPEFVSVGGFGNVLDIDDSSTAALLFGFDASSLTFIYGGNSGVFDVEALDANNQVVDSFFQASTDAGQPAGPLTLSGAGIRSLVWTDPGSNFAAIDNIAITISTVPEPGSVIVVGIALLGLALKRTRHVID